jgi:hypothetical protein
MWNTLPPYSGLKSKTKEETSIKLAPVTGLFVNCFMRVSCSVLKTWAHKTELFAFNDNS